MSKCVLIVDDSEEDRVLYKRYLKGSENNYQILEASCQSGGAYQQTALAMYQEHQPDCVLLDYRLPDTDGLSLLEKFKEVTKSNRLCLIMITGQGSESVAVRALHNGAIDYLIKDEITKDLFQKAVANAIEKCELRTQVAQQHDEIMTMNQQLQATLDELSEREKALRLQTQKLADANNALHLSQQQEKEARLEAEQQRNRLQTLFQQSPATINTFLGPNHVFDLVHPNGFPEAAQPDVKGKPIREVVPDLSSKLLEKMDFVFQQGVEYQEQAFSVSEADGVQKYYDLFFQPLFDIHGAVEGLMTFVIDVTSQVLARHAIKESETRLRLILDTLPQIAWTSEQNGDLSFINKKWYETTGSTPTTMADWAPHVHPKDLPAVRGEWNDALKKGFFECRYRLKSANGKYLWMLGRSAPVKNQSGETLMWVGTATNIHRLQRNQHKLKRMSEMIARKNEELLRINEDLDTFVYMASHDLKSPVNTLTSLASLFQSKIADKLNAQEKKMLDMMQSSTRTLNRILLDLAETAQVQQTMHDQKEVVGIAKAVSEVQEGLQEMIASNHATVQVDLQEPNVIVAYKNLRSILYNLTTNAIKYRHPERPPIIRIRSYRESSYVVLVVSDNGSGLSAKQQQKLFTAFRRFHPNIEGSGIGLYMIKKIVDNNQGKIEVESKPEEGTTFRIFLPSN